MTISWGHLRRDRLQDRFGGGDEKGVASREVVRSRPRWQPRLPVDRTVSKAPQANGCNPP